MPLHRSLLAASLVLAFVFAAGPAHAAVNRGWVATGAMSTGRTAHSAVLLDNGKVLVAGGDIANVLTRTAELYDPATGTWSAAASMGEARSWFGMVKFANGQVLAAGGLGEAGASLKSAELYDPATNRWSAAANTMSTGRMEAPLTLLENGRALITGGMFSDGNSDNEAYLATSELFDPATRTWSSVDGFTGARTAVAAVPLPGNRVLMAGGTGEAGGAFRDAWAYDPTRHRWDQARIMSVARVFFTLNALPGGVVLAAGGANHDGYLASAELYDTQLGVWTATLPMATNHSMHTASTLAGGKVLVAGGYEDVRPTTTTELFDPGTNAWSTRSATLTFAANVASATQAVPLSGRGAGVFGAVPDADGDGVGDGTDRCQELKGPAGRTGCPLGLLNDPSIRYRQGKSGIRVLAYYVKATTGARIVVSCSKGCKRTVAKGRGAKRVRIAGLNGRRLTNGTKITVTVSMPGRLTTTVHDNVARGRRVEGRSRCSQPGTLGPLLGC